MIWEKVGTILWSIKSYPWQEDLPWQIGGGAKPTTSYSGITKPSTNYSKTTKPTTNYTNINKPNG